MAITQNFNINPYYDDFDEDKGYHRLLFRPGYAVQSRELTQLQTILQNQIEKFGKHIFKQGSMVIGGQTTYENESVYYLKLQTADSNSNVVDVSNFVNKFITDSTGNIRAYVIAAESSNDTDPKTLIIKYLSDSRFTDNQSIQDETSNYFALTALSSSSGNASVISIDDGVFFIDGFFVKIVKQTLILEKYSDSPSYRIGIEIVDSIIDENDDTSLLDPALEASNFQAPGAKRFEIVLTLSKRSLTSEDDSKFINLVVVENGSIKQRTVFPNYSVLEDTLARRTHDESGDYIVNPFFISFTNDKITNLANSYNIVVGPGKAYVKGYEFETISPTTIVSKRAQDYLTVLNYPLTINYQNYIDIENIVGDLDLQEFGTLNVHCVPVSTLDNASADTLSATRMGTVRVRALDYQYGANTTSTLNAVYRAYVFDTSIGTRTGTAQSGTANTLVLDTNAATQDDAYVGIRLTITAFSGNTAQTETKVVQSYNGTTKTATVDGTWSYGVPDSSTEFSLDYEFKDAESFIITNAGLTVTTSADISDDSKYSILTDDYQGAYISETNFNNLLISLPNSTIKESSLLNTEYFARKQYDITFTSGVATFSTGSIGTKGVISAVLGTPISATDAMDNFFVILADGTLVNFLDSVNNNVEASTTGSGDATSSSVTINAAAAGTQNATVYMKVKIGVGEATIKLKQVADTANVTTTGADTIVTGNIFLHLAETDQPGLQLIINSNYTSNLKNSQNTQSLYTADVIELTGVYDFGANSVTQANLEYAIDITDNYTLDNGQRDNFYDHASIRLIPGYKGPTGNVIIFADYYSSSGVSYFTIDSYPDTYANIPIYESPNSGNSYKLRDMIDFRPIKKSGTNGIAGQFNEKVLGISGSAFETDYSYYLARIDKLIVTKDRTFEVVNGVSSLTPVPPKDRSDAMTIYTLILPAYTGEVQEIKARFVENRRYTMRDIGNIEQRVQNLEYYSTLNFLEKTAAGEQFLDDSTGLPRVKTGIIVDPFTGHKIADVSSEDYNASIDIQSKEVRPAFETNQFRFEIDPDNSTNYSANTIYVTKNYTQESFVEQPQSSFVLSINPFNFPVIDGTTQLEAVDAEYPDQAQPPEVNDNLDGINDSWAYCLQQWRITSRRGGFFRLGRKRIKKTFKGWKCYGREWNWWANRIRNFSYYNTKLIEKEIADLKKKGLYNENFNDFITAVAREVFNGQELVPDKLTPSTQQGMFKTVVQSVVLRRKRKNVYFRAKGLTPKSRVKGYLNGKDISNFILKPDVIQIEHDSVFWPLKYWRWHFRNGENFKIVDPALPGNKIIARGRIDYIEWLSYSRANVHLYVTESGTDTLYNKKDTERVITSNTTFLLTNEPGRVANNRIISYTPYFSHVNVATSNTVQVTGKFANSNTALNMVGEKLTIVSGSGAGQTANIISYDTETRTITVDTDFNVIPGAISNSTVFKEDRSMISIGELYADSTGTFPGLLMVPSILETDTAEAIFNKNYKKNILKFVSQNTNIISVGVDDPDPETVTDDSAVTKYSIDPFAQTFVIDEKLHPQGVSLTTIRLLFKQKDESYPVQIQIRPTTGDGVPSTSAMGSATVKNGTTYLHPEDINEISLETMNALNLAGTNLFSDSQYYSEALFDTPVYLEPGKTYALVITSVSSKHELYMSRIGDKLLGTDRVISAQPYLGVLYKTQNSSEWIPFPNEDLCFQMTKATYDTEAVSTIRLRLRALPEDIDNYGIQGIIDLEGTAPESNVNVNAIYLTTDENAFVNTTATFKFKTTRQDGTLEAFRSIEPSDNFEFKDSYGPRVITSNNESFVVEIDLDTVNPDIAPSFDLSKVHLITINNIIDNNEITDNDIVITNAGQDYSNSQNVIVTISGGGGSGATAIANVVNGGIDEIYITNPGSGYTSSPTITISGDTTSTINAEAVIIGEDQPYGGVADAKYITRKVTLADGFDGGDLRVLFSAYKPIGTTIDVYYKVLSQDDADSFDNKRWKQMTMLGGLNSYSLSDDDIKNYIYAPGSNNLADNYINYDGFTTFKHFAIKIVMRSTNTNLVPKVSNFRTIALSELL